MRPTELTAIADKVVGLYKSYQFALSGLFSRIVDGLAPTYPKAREQFAIDSQAILASVLNGIKPTIDEAVQRCMNTALRDANLPLPADRLKTLTDLIDEARAELISNIVNAMMKDAQAPLKKLRELAMNVDHIMNTNGIAYSTAIQIAETNMSLDLQFGQQDRAGRTWGSQKFIHNMVRQMMVRTYVETYLYAMTVANIDVARLIHDDSEHEFAGDLFSISGATPKMPTYLEIRDTVFHPNSNFMVGKP